jgi:hypothetical protein
MHLEPGRDEVIRRFWSLFLNAPIASDGSVKGFREAWNKLSPWAQRQCDLYAEAAFAKLERGGREMDECIAAGVKALRERLLEEPPPSSRPRPEYARFRVELIGRIIEQDLTPTAVAEILEAAADRFPEIHYSECVGLRQQGDVWQPLSGPRLTPERMAQIKARPPLRLTDADVARAKEQAAAIREQLGLTA